MKLIKSKTFIFLIIAVIAYLFVNPYYLFPDGQGYFSYLSSLFYDGDIDFYNDFVNMRIPIPLALTQSGYISNNWSVGTAFFWSPFYLVAKALASSDVNPYSNWFWFWVNSGTVFYGLVTFYLLLLILKKLFPADNMVLAAAVSFVATPMFFYTFTLSCTAHAITAFTVTLFLWAWIYTLPKEGLNEKDKGNKRFVILGLILGLAFMVRPQEAIFGIVILVELLFSLRTEFVRSLKSGIVFAVSFLIGASPQLIIWKIFYGSFFYAPSKFNVSLKYFALAQTLFSSYHGILLWTPIFFIAFLGLCFGLLKNVKVFAGLLLAFLAQLLINSCCVAYWEGYSFGLRQMVSTLPLVAIGVAQFWKFFEKKSGIIKVLGLAMVALPGLWTLGLLANYYIGLDLLGYLSLKDILARQSSLVFDLPKLASKFAGLTRPEFSLLAGILLVWFVFYTVLDKLKTLFEKGKLQFIIIFLTLILAGYDIIIVKAHFNKPQRQGVETKDFISPAQLDGFFVKQVEDLKVKYNLK